jgi:hypothetical protein
MVNDKARRTFLVQLDLGLKLIPISDDNLIVCSVGYGPVFGGIGSYDMYITNECNRGKGTGAGYLAHYKG